MKIFVSCLSLLMACFFVIGSIILLGIIVPVEVMRELVRKLEKHL